MRTVDEGIVVQGADGSRIYANDAAARLVGFEDAAAFLAADAATVLDAFEMLDESGEAVAAADLPGRRALGGETAERLIRYRIRATGEERWSIVRANPIRVEAGAVVA
jgi:PAS domain-containing protein